MSDNRVWWNGEQLGDEVLGLSLAGSDLPGHVLAAGHDRTDLVRPDQLHRFLVCHASQRFACYDVAPLHWTIHQQLVNDPVGQELLWDISRASRFLDVDLLDQRYRLASDGVNPQCRSLEKLADAYGISEPPESGSTLPVPVRQGRQPKAILRLYQELDRRIKAFLQRTRIPLDLACCFGPLGHGLDVQGAIAVGSPGTTLVVSTEGAAQLERATQQKYRLSSDLLVKDRRVSRCFHWEGELVARDEVGSVRWKEGKLREWLASRADELYDISERPLGRPLDDRGRVSLDPDHWGALTCGHPQLRAWSELIRAARLERAFREIDGQRLGIRYRVVPRLQAYSPELAETRQLVEGVFQPGPGKRFLVYHLKDLHLRCLALVAEKRWRVGRLGQMFRDRENPVPEFAEQLMDRAVERAATKSDNEDDSRTDRESSIHPERTWADHVSPEYWRRLAEILLRAVPCGLPARYTRKLLRDCLPEADLTELEMEVLQSEFFQHLCPELEVFLTDSTIEQLADRIGADRVSLVEALLDEFRACEPAPLALAATVWEAFQAGKGEGALRVLKSAATAPEALRMLESGEVLDLLAQWPVTFFGQVGQRTTGSRSRVLEVENLADAIRKRICFAIVAAGHPVVAVADDEIVVQVSRSGTPGQDSIIMCLQEAVQGLWAAVPQEYRPRRNVPIVVEQEWGDQW